MWLISDYLEEFIYLPSAHLSYDFTHIYCVYFITGQVILREVDLQSDLTVAIMCNVIVQRLYLLYSIYSANAQC